VSEQTAPLTYEGILELFRQAHLRMDRMTQDADWRWEKLERQMEKTDEQIRRTNQDVGGLTSSVGALVSSMVSGNIIEKFEALGYDDLDRCCEKQKFKNKKLGIKGEIDLFLENGDIAILIEVKTSLDTKDVRKHIERLEKFRRYSDVRGDKRRFVGAVAGASIEEEAMEFAHENGLYVIVQSGDAVEIVTPPEGFVAKKW